MKKISFTVPFILIAALAFAQQPEKIRVKNYRIHGASKNRKALERLLDDSIDSGEIVVGQRTEIQVNGRFAIGSSQPVDKAVMDFIVKHRDAFELKNPKKELKIEKNNSNERFIVFDQRYDGLPVWKNCRKANILIYLNEKHEIDHLSGNNIPTPDIKMKPALTIYEAAAKAGIKVDPNNIGLVIYENKLAYGLAKDFGIVFIDANDGHMLGYCQIWIPPEPA